MTRFLTRFLVLLLLAALVLAAVVYESARYPFIVGAPFLVLVFLVLFYRSHLGRPAQVRRRARALRWRARLRLRPGPGYASLFELIFRWGRLAALSHGRRARPGLGYLARLFSCTTDYAVRLGRAQYGRRAYARMEDQVLVLAPQRTGKSGLLADRILSHPGAVLATSTRPDLFNITAGARSRRGPIDVFNPQGVGGLPSTFGWSILEPCRDLVMARRVAGWLAGGVLEGKGSQGNIEWFEKKGDVALMALLWAAAVTGRTILDVYEWVQLQGHATCLEILASHPDSTRQMFAVAKRMFEENRTSGSIRDTVDLTLSWAIIPGLAEAVTPPPGEGFDLDRFIALDGTLYMIASGDEDSPVTPLFRAFASYVHYAAGLIGTMTPAGKLDPPLLFALDEVTTICPVDLPTMLSDSAGKGQLFIAVAHGTSQLKDRWGEFGGQTVWDTCGTKILLGGLSDTETLEEASKLCGTVVIGPDGDQPVPVVPPEFLRGLPDWRALVIRMNLNPLIVKIRPAWKRPGYRRARLPVPQLRPMPRPVWEAATLELAELGASDTPEAFPYAGSLTRTGTDD